MFLGFDRKLILETGEEYPGKGFGADSERICELVFNTSMVGYQEIISDPSYTYQAIVMTYPIIGNYGIADDDFETIIPTAGALIVREYNDQPSNFRSNATLSDTLRKYGIPGISGVDTRMIARSIRDHGTRRAMITSADTDTKEAVKRIAGSAIPKDAVSKVSCHEFRYFPAPHERFHVVAIDCGMKQNIVRSLNRRGCSVTAVPWCTSFADIEKLAPDGVLISNGPGDPTDVPEVINTVSELRGKLPMFGICLGHQIISLAYGARTYKLKFGHRGGNHPVRDLTTGKIEITSQNHSFAVLPHSAEAAGLEITHINLLDGTVEGVMCRKDRVFGVQYHPESAPGPQDSGHLFERFVSMMEEAKLDA